jgi:methionyl-tRNA synthetase
LNEWLSDGLVDWDITRDTPYFGFNIPGTKDKFFYVWMDAPIGYIASHKNYCEKNDKNFDEYWKSDSNCELYHFIGKDIAYFHALFWPAMLEGSGFRKPNAVYCHGFLTINGEKMSKSRGTFFNARTYLNHLNPEYLRYYFASRLADKIEDIDLNFDDFQSRVNSDLVGKIINIGSRCSKFINKDFSNELSATFNNEKLINNCLSHLDEIINNYEGRNFSTNIRLISSMADDINKYLDEEKPWVKIKDKNNHELVQKICTDGMNLFRILIGYLKPVLPKISEKVENIMQCEPINWENIKDLILSKKIQKFKPIITRIDKDSLEGMINESGENNK